MKQKNLKFSIYNESDMHRQLKKYFSQDGALFEHELDGYVIDLFQSNSIYEIQTGNFSAIKKKLSILLEKYSIYLIHPIIKNKIIIKYAVDGEQISKRISPRHGTIYDLFKQTIYIPEFLYHSNFHLIGQEVDIHEIWIDDGQGSWRRKKFSIYNRNIVAFHKQYSFTNEDDFLKLLPFEKGTQFTNKDLAQSLKVDVRLARKFTFTLRKAGSLEIVGKDGRALLFTQSRV